MIAELVGLPGSGKSTFARALASEGKWTVVSVAGVRDILWNNVLFFFRHPLFFLRGLYVFARFAPPRAHLYTLFLNLFLVHNAKYMKASRLPFAVIDQGYMHNVIGLLPRALSRVELQSFISSYPLPDYLLYFVADEDVRTKRQAARGRIARSDRSEEDLEAWSLVSEKNFETLYLLRDDSFSQVMVVTDETADDVRKNLARAQLLCFVMHVRMPTEKAHGLQIAQTLDALTKEGVHTELWVSARKNPITENLFSYYGITSRFPVRYVHHPSILPRLSFLGALAYWIDATFFLIALLFARIDTQARYYTRNAEIAWLIAVKGGRVWYEAHNWPNSKTALFCFFLKKTSGIITNSQGTRDAYVSHGFPHVTVIQNGVDIEKFALDDSSHEARRARDLPLHVPLVMYVGSFARWKGVATVIAAWKRVKEGHPDAQLVLIGGTVEALKKFPECTDDILSARVIVRAHQSSALIPLYLRAADILLLPNEPVSEEAIRFTSPIKLFEYMASGRPIIASNLPSMREILNDTNAVLFTAGDAKELSSAILSLLADNRKKESCARSARADVEEFSWTNRAKRIMDTIDFH